MILRNPRYENFAQAVARGARAGRAYEEAGFRIKPGTGHLAGWRLMKNPEIKARIAELQSEATAECRIDRLRLLDFLSDVIQTSACDVPEESPLCQAFYRSEKVFSSQMPDKLRAVELLVKLCGWEKPPRPEEQKEMKIVIGGDGA
jgi:hypothetical protein